MKARLLQGRMSAVACPSVASFEPLLHYHFLLLHHHVPLLHHHVPLLRYHVPLLHYHDPILRHHAPLLHYHVPLLHYHVPLLHYHVPLLHHHIPIFASSRVHFSTLSHWPVFRYTVSEFRVPSPTCGKQLPPHCTCALDDDQTDTSIWRQSLATGPCRG